MSRYTVRRRVGLIYLALSAGVIIAVLELSQHFQLGVASTAVTLLLGVPTLFLAWASFRWQGDRDPNLAEVADQLAAAVSRQWEAEAELRRLDDPHPLPVAWTAADAPLTEDWPSLTLTASEWPGAMAASKDEWASSPEGLAGSGGELVDVLIRRVPTRRLVVLGAPGAGKTLLLVRLVQDLLSRRQAGDTVPVLVSLASWNPRQQDLRSWLASRLATDYPGLREPASGSAEGTNQLGALLDKKMLFLLLDGLDEIPGNVRGIAIARINNALRPGEGVVVSCRAEQYKQAVDPDDGPPVKLHGATGIELRDLDSGAVKFYLRRDAMSVAAADRWQPVFAALDSGNPVVQALRTPLMVGLARTIYNPRPGEHAAALPDPAELCDSQQFPARADVEGHLFDAFVAAAYRPHPDPFRRCRWSGEQAERWLVYLAGHLTYNLAGTTDLAWWELRGAAPRPLSGLVAGLISGLAIGIAAWLGPRLGVGVGMGLIVGLPVGIAVRLRAGLRAGLKGLRAETKFGVVGGVAAGATGGILGGFLGGAIVNAPTAGLVGGAAIAIGIGPISGLAGGFVGCLVGGLSVGLTASHATGSAAGLVDGLGGALAAAFCVEFAGRHKPARGLRGLRWTPVGLGSGAVAALGIGITLGITTKPLTGVVAGLTVGLADAMAFGLEGTAPDSEIVAAPSTSLADDRKTFLAVGCAAGIGFGLGGGIGVWMGVGLAAAIVVGLGAGFFQAAYGHYIITRCWLALRHHLPWRLMSFLADAHENRGILRQVGAIYQFRHAELQRRLSDRT